MPSKFTQYEEQNCAPEEKHSKPVLSGDLDSGQAVDSSALSEISQMLNYMDNKLNAIDRITAKPP